jgi:negative regulator of sigma E activity
MTSQTMTVKASDKKAILMLLYHVRMDLSYGYEGSFVNTKGDNINKREYAQVKKAHDLLYKLVSDA